jgi:hypothetical protein
MDPALSGNRGFRRIFMVAAGATLLAGAGTFALAQESDQQIRCMQLQQELAAQAGGGAGREALPGIQQQIAQYQRVYDGTRAAMQDAGCFESFFIFGRALVRSPKCLSMGDRADDARRQLDALQDQRNAILSGGGNQRRQAELRDALARSGCSGQPPQQARRGGGGLFDWFSGGNEEEVEPEGTDMTISRSINPNAPYRTVCVRLCDGFAYPISYSTYASHFSQDATQCQQNCAAPAELYVYRNPGQELEQAISLTGSPYKDLPVAFKYRKSYTAGCSCKQAEYNPTEIEQANKRAEATPPTKPGAKPAKKAAAPAPVAAPAPQAAAPQAAPAPPAPGTEAAGSPPQINLDSIKNGSIGTVTGSSSEADAEDGAPPEAAPPAPQAAAPATPATTGSTIAKRKTPPAPAPQ